ncbi:predicted protein [Uncinocarpus reesii 1704]|uniref:Protein kinase domain-containing protein n=1 Tax=Uncinocarpus reesii (strain UAMH 1704) TaxID=336963 RepID=C4JVP5_UNCRE|nr:uncharacterized protein UREG_06637 [Uncinocarpus reesii 1704]EEP81772.1 predicted protein [Uncinocarpus reesii 1704]
MPDIYKAPEVILHMKWDYKVDVWSFGMMVWHMVTGSPLFNGRSPDNTFQDDRVHLAEMTAIMGPPPAELIKRSGMSRAVWNDDGSWKGVVPLPEITLEGLGEGITGEDRDEFFGGLGVYCAGSQRREQLLRNFYLTHG